MSTRRRIAVVTGTRAEYGLLRSVMAAIRDHPSLALETWVTGTHLLPGHDTVAEIDPSFTITRRVPMQRSDDVGRAADAAALGRGVEGFAGALRSDPPDVVLVLGDRIEAFAAAAAAAVAGVRVAHMHGGDRAEGVADESLRHAVTKMAHIHLPATRTSAQRIIAMGEEPTRVHVVGSPAIDGLDAVPPMPEPEYALLGSPKIVVLLHPVGDDDEIELERAAKLLQAAADAGPTLALAPNHDPGRAGVVKAIERSGCRSVGHLARPAFLGLLRRAAVLVGNSSAGLIEAAAMPIHAINIGRRQAGRERPANVIDAPDRDYQTIADAIRRCLSTPARRVDHPYGDGRAGVKTADLLATLDLAVHGVVKRNSY